MVLTLRATAAVCGALGALWLLGALDHAWAQREQIPDRPTGLVAVAAHDQVVLIWDNPDDTTITHYQIFRRDRDIHPSGMFITIEPDTGTPATTYVDQTAEAEKSYVYRVAAVNTHGAGKWSGYARADTPPRPIPDPDPDPDPDPGLLAPSRLAVALVEDQVTLTWEAPAVDARSVTGYQILRRRPLEGETLGVLVTDTATTATTYIDASANQAGVRYTYRVKAWRRTELSGWSNYVRIDLPDDYLQPQADETTLAPSNLRAHTREDGITLTWDPPAADAESVTGYAVARTGDGTRFETLVVDTTYVDRTELAGGGTYTYVVYALRDRQRSGPSNAAVVHIPQSSQLAPTNLVAQWTEHGITLTWDPPAAYPERVTSYQTLRVRYPPDGRGAEVATIDTGSSATAHTDRDATDPNSRYTYRVRAIRNDTTSPWSPKAETRPTTQTTPAHIQTQAPDPFVEARQTRSGEGSRTPQTSDGPVYTWRDGDRTLRVVLQNSLDVGEETPRQPRVSEGATRYFTPFSAPEGNSRAGTEPVFRPESGGGLMRLPGGVLLMFEPDRTPAQIDAFFVRNQISRKKVERMPGIPNAFLVETDPGFPSLNLANALADQDGIAVSSPNWEVELETHQTDDEDEHGDTIQTATDLELDTSLESELEDPDDVDFFKITLPTDTDLTVVCVRCLETLTLYDREGVQLASSEEAIAETTRPAGVYYIKVSPGTDPDDSPFYHLFAQTFDHGDTIEDASEIELGTTLNPIIYPVGETDMFKFVLTEFTEFVIETQGYEDRQLSLWDDSGVELVEPGRFAAGTFGAGTYYVMVGGDPVSEGSYELRTLVIAEQEDSRSGARSLDLEETAYGGISGRDVDWFKIELDEPTEVTLQFELIEESLVPALVVAEVQDSNGNILRGAIQSSVSNVTISDYSLTAGTTFLRVASRDGELDFDFFDTLYFGIGLTRNTEYEEFIQTCTGIATTVSDPLYSCQWHLSNTTDGEDAGIGDVWESYTGEGVRVTVVDYGVDVDHEDLAANADRDRSWTADQRSDIYYPQSSHGTSVAGIIAARDNSVGVRGVAPRATLQSHDLLSRPTLSNQVLAAVRNTEDTAVSNNSWGYRGSGPNLAHSFWESAIRGGIDYGYGGKGTVYVLAAGNSHQIGAHANLDERVNFYGVVPVCAVDADGRRAEYSETGANLWVCAPAAAVTTANADRYRDDFGGTSSSAPVVSGVVALMREANPELTWRDTKLILAASARKNDPAHAGWETGAPKYRAEADTDRYSFNHEYGFGVVDAERAVTQAEDWPNAPSLRTATASSPDSLITIPNPAPGVEPTTVTSSITLDTDIDFVEFVQIDAHFNHSSFRTLDIELVSPSGAVSTLSFFDDFSRAWLEGEFRFGSARHLGEDPSGTWTLRVTDRFAGTAPSGYLAQWSITVYGHGTPPDAPTIHSATPDPGSLAVGWAAPAEGGSTPIISYDLRHIRSDATDPTEDDWTLLEGLPAAGTLRHRIGGLLNGAEYDIEVRAHNTDGPGPWSATSTGTPRATPAAPIIDTVAAGDGSLTVRWTAPTSTGGRTITGYDLRHIRSDATDRADPDWTLVENAARPTDLVATISSLTNGSEYDIQVRAAFNTEDGPWSATFWGTPATTPTSPTVTTATSGDGTLTVEWAAPTTTGGSPITHYHLRHILIDAPDKSDANWTETIAAWTPGEPPAFVLTGLTNGAEHDIQIRAANAAGPGPWSATYTATPGTTPGPPILLDLYGEDQALDARWDSPSESGGLDIASYDLRYIRSTAANKDDTAWTVLEDILTATDADFDDPEYTISDLVNGAEYHVQVRAINAAGEGPWSYTGTQTPWDPDIKPTLTELVAVDRTFVARWEPPPDKIGDARLDGFTIFITPMLGYTTGGYFGFIYEATTREYVFDYRRPLFGVEHTVDVTAWYGTPTGDSVRGGRSDPLTVTLRAEPAAPSIGSVFPGDESLVVDFVAPGDDGGSPITSYDARYIRSDAPDKADANWTERAAVWTSGDSWFELGGLTNAVGYDLRIRAVNDVGAGPWSSTTTGTPTSTPDGTPFFPGTYLRARSVEENSAAGTLVGAPVAAYDADGHTLTYFLYGVGGAFDIDPYTGQITVSAGTTLDHETSPVYPVVVWVRDGVDADGDPDTTIDDEAGVSIRVTDVNELVAVDDYVTTGPDDPVYIYALENDTSPGREDDLRIESVGSYPANGRAYLSRSDRIRYWPDDDFTGEDQFTYIVTDGAHEAEATIYVTVGGNRGPRFPATEGGQREITMPENTPPGTSIGEPVVAIDPDGDTLTYVLWDDPYIPDHGYFAVDSDTGQLSLGATALDYENPVAIHGGNWYYFRVGVHDGKDAEGNPDTTVDHWLGIGVEVTDVDEAPELFGPQEIHHPENRADVWNFGVADPEGDAITWSVAGDDHARFTVNERGKLSFREAPDHEAPGDDGGDNVYQVTVRAADGTHTTTLDVDVTVTDVDEPLAIEGPDDVARSENTLVVADYDAIDPEDDPITWSLSGRDAGRFRINSAGTLRFHQAPDFESPADTGRNNVYDVTVRAAAGTHTTTLDVDVTVTDVNEPPIISGPGSVNFGERGVGTVATFTVMDPESGTVIWSVEGTDVGDFTISDTGVLRFGTPPDFEEPADADRDNVYVVTVAVSDGPNTASHDVVVTVTDVNEAPTVVGQAAFDFVENRTDLIGLFSATDPDANATISWGMSGIDRGDFTISEAGGLSFADPPDFESPEDTNRNNEYLVTVLASDGELTGTLEVVVTVMDVDEPPEIAGPETVEFAENGTGTVATYRAWDPEGEPLEWLPLAGADSDAFGFGADGALTFRSSPDFEAQDEYYLIVGVTDGGLTSTVAVTVAVTDVDEPPVVSGQGHVTVVENSGVYVGRYRAADPEDTAADWVGLSGPDRNHFEFTDTGDLSFTTLPDFESPADSGRNNVYDVTVQASDGDLTGTLDVTVTVTDVNEPPVISGPGSVDFAEHGAGEVADYGVYDPEQATVIWSLGGADVGDFTISDSGVLRFGTPPNFEEPADADRDNVYGVTLRASDGPNTSSHGVVVTVRNQDEPGSLGLSSEQPQVNTPLSAMLTDPDGVVSQSWSWERSLDGNSWGPVSGAAAAVYVPVDGDLDHYLRVTVSYTDGHGGGKSLAATPGFATEADPGANRSPEFPPGIVPRSVDENSVGGTPVGAPVTATDADGDPLSYTLYAVGGAEGVFTIDNRGQIRVAPLAVLDYEALTYPYHSVAVIARDPSNEEAEATVLIEINDVNEAPVAVADQESTSEDQAVIVDVLGNDSDPEGDDLAVSLGDRPRNGSVTVETDQRITYTPDADYHGADSFSYRVSDGSLSSEATVSVTVNAVNDPPRFPAATAERSVTAGAAGGTSVGAPVTATDVDGDVLSYTMGGTSEFIIGEHTAQISVAAGAVLDPGVGFVVTVTARDPSGASANIEVAISVVDPPPPPPPPPPTGSGGGGGGGGGPVQDPGAPAFDEGSRAVRSAPENSPAGVAIGAPVTATDPDGDPLVYTLGGTDAEAFTIDAATGQLRTKAALDYETRDSYRVTVSVRDNKNPEGEDDTARDDTIRVAINVGNRNDPGRVVLSAPTPRVGQPLQAALTDVDGGISDIAWKWWRSTDRTTWTPIPDATTNTYTPIPADVDHHLRAAATYGDLFGPDQVAETTPDSPVVVGYTTGFGDVAPDGVHTPAIEALAVQGVFADTGCGPERFCPHQPIQRWTMAVWLIRALTPSDLPHPGVSRFVDISAGLWWTFYVEALADRRITIGCDTHPPRYCPNQAVTRAQMATFLTRALQLPPARAPAGFTDTEGNTHQTNIDTLAAAGITAGCDTDPPRYCPNQAVTRAQMATFLHRTLTHQPRPGPDPNTETPRQDHNDSSMLYLDE